MRPVKAMVFIHRTKSSRLKPLLQRPPQQPAHDPWPMHRAPRLLRCAGYYFCGIHTMRHLLTCLALLPLAGALAGPTFARAPTPLPLDQVMADLDWLGSGVADAWWSWDGKHPHNTPTHPR